MSVDLYIDASILSIRTGFEAANLLLFIVSLLSGRSSGRRAITFLGEEAISFFKPLTTPTSLWRVVEVIESSLACGTGRKWCKAFTFFESVSFDYLASSTLTVEALRIPTLGFSTSTSSIVTVAGHSVGDLDRFSTVGAPSRMVGTVFERILQLVGGGWANG